MRDYNLAHLSDDVLLRSLTALAVRDRVTTATLLAHIAEVDARRLFVPAGYASMHAYCVDELRLSEDAAYKRIRAARAAREFPALFTAVAEGRLHLAAVCLLAPHLKPENAKELIAAATHRRKSEIEQWLARSFPIPGFGASVRAVPSFEPEVASQLAPGRVESDSPTLDPNQDQLAPGRVEHPRGEALPTPERYLVQVTIAKSTQEKLAYAQTLLSHAVPSGDVAQVLDRALDVLIEQLEKRKLGATSRREHAPYREPGADPGRDLGTVVQRPRRSTGRDRYVPAPVRRAVWERDQGQCTYVSANGHRCTSRQFLEFDHVEPVALGGRATVNGMRLRCRAHNQFEAEQVFGAAFMRRKRHKARLAATKARARTLAGERATDECAANECAANERAKEQARDVMVALRGLGCRAEEARRVTELSQRLPCATLEERMRAALTFLGRR
jgi:5-methylcytosine-specific restriction endonuclease McrA